jgi:hypothetical protein
MNENCIKIPEAMKDQLEPEGTLEIAYKLTEKEGVPYIQVTSVEGESVEVAEESPMDRMASKMGMKKKFGGPKAEEAYEEGL